MKRKSKTTANAKKKKVQAFFSGDILALAFSAFKEKDLEGAVKSVLFAFEAADCDKLMQTILRHNEKASDDTDAEIESDEEEDEENDEEAADKEQAEDDDGDDADEDDACEMSGDDDDDDGNPFADDDDSDGEEAGDEDSDNDDDDADEEEASSEDKVIAKTIASLYATEKPKKKPAETAAKKVDKKTEKAAKKQEKASTAVKPKGAAARVTAKMNLMSLSGSAKDRALAAKLTKSLKLKK